MLARGETSLQLQTDVPREFVIILQGILIMSVVVTYQVAKRRLFARQLHRAAEVEDLRRRGGRRRHRQATRDGSRSLMPLGDLGAAIGIALTYFTIIYLTGLGGLFSERSGIVNIGLEGMMIIGTVTGSWGTRYFTSTTVGSGLPWGPIVGLLIGMAAGAIFASIHALATVTFQVDQIVSGVVINLVAIGRGPLPVARLLRPGDAVRLRAAPPGPDRHPAARRPAAAASGGRSRTSRRW